METIVLKPQKEQKTMWFIGWALPFAIGSALWLILLLVIPPSDCPRFIFGLVLALWLLLMLLIALWISAFYSSIEYIIDSDSIKGKKGVFWRRRVTVPFTKITNLDITQGPVQRIFDIGTIHVQTAGAGGPQGTQAELKLLGIRDLDEVKDTIMEKVRGYAISRVDQLEEKVVQESDSQILERVLKELTAIRKVLENKHD